MTYKQRLKELSLRKVGSETSRTYVDKLLNGFWDKYCSGKTLEQGYSGYSDSVPLFPETVGLSLDTPGYDGKTIPYPNESFDTVYSSHVIEHVSDLKGFIQEQHRVTKTNGYIIIVSPHQYLYERKLELPSNWNGDHKIFLSPGKLLTIIESVLKPNTYRVRLLEDNDSEYNYSVPLQQHPDGGYEILVVLQKIQPPEWNLE